MKYKKLPKILPNDIQTYARIEDNGKSYISCTDDDQDFKNWIAAGNTAEAADTEHTDWDKARAKRDSLLTASDWTMTTGATVDQAQWSAYREKLRDIPQTYKDKETSEIVWPTAPSSKGPNS
tara:strand:- start:251 stop:616 length:366 start_codon:yes stop_codon:yes gene_type:complete